MKNMKNTKDINNTNKKFEEFLNNYEKEIKQTINNDKHYCYILKCSDGTLYTGYAKNPIKRLYEHNFLDKGAKYTKKRRPVHLVKIFEFDSRSDAMKEEFRIKHLSRKQKIDIINN